MEGSESEVVFESLNLNPQLFINETLNTVDDLLDEAFHFFHQEASALLKTDGTSRSQFISEGIAYVRDMIQSDLDTRLGMWEKYCLHHVFAVPEGFSLPQTVCSLLTNPCSPSFLIIFVLVSFFAFHDRQPFMDFKFLLCQLSIYWIALQGF